MEKLNGKGAGMSLAALLGGLYAICLFAFYLFPESTAELGNTMFHGIIVENTPMTFESAIAGLVAWILTGMISGALFAALYNRFSD